MPNALVTGATGHIGAHLVRALCDANEQVAIFRRQTSDTIGIDGLDVEHRLGDLLDPASLRAAVEGCEVVYHLAAVHRNWAPTAEAFDGPNIDGTRNLLEAARDAGCRRVVLTASQATIGYTSDPNHPLDESHHNKELHLDYVRSKVAAERLALGFSAEGGPEVVVVCPAVTTGALDYRMTPTSAALRDVITGGPSLVGISLTHARDVAEGHRLAALHGKPGERYILGGENLTREDAARRIAALTGRKPNLMVPPKFIVSILAHLGPLIARFQGTDASLSPAVLKTAWGRHMLYSSKKAQEELGYSFRPADDTLREIIRWQAFMGWLPKKLVNSLPSELSTPDPSWKPPRKR